MKVSIVNARKAVTYNERANAIADGGLIDTQMSEETREARKKMNDESDTDFQPEEKQDESADEGHTDNEMNPAEISSERPTAPGGIAGGSEGALPATRIGPQLPKRNRPPTNSPSHRTKKALKKSNAVDPNICKLCGLSHFGNNGPCPHIGTEAQIRQMREALNHSQEPALVRDGALSYLESAHRVLIRQNKAMEREQRRNQLNPINLDGLTLTAVTNQAPQTTMQTMQPVVDLRPSNLGSNMGYQVPNLTARGIQGVPLAGSCIEGGSFGYPAPQSTLQMMQPVASAGASIQGNNYGCPAPHPTSTSMQPVAFARPFDQGNNPGYSTPRLTTQPMQGFAAAGMPGQVSDFGRPVHQSTTPTLHAVASAGVRNQESMLKPGGPELPS